MKLSIITPIYKNKKTLNRILRKFEEQDSNNFELILIIDTDTNQILKVVDEYKDSFGKKLKIIFNSKRIGRISALMAGIKEASGTHTIIMEGTNKFSSTNFVSETLKNMENISAEIIEFDAKFKDPIKFRGKIRKKFNNSTNIEEDPSVIAYSYPFTFNKIFKTSLLKKVINDLNEEDTINSRFSIELNYKALLHAKTYQTVNKTLVISSSLILDNYNPIKSMNESKSLIKWSENNKKDLSEELKYAMFFNTTIFIFAFTSKLKNKIITRKLTEKFKKEMSSTLESLMDKNKYIISDVKESKNLLKYYSINTISKLHNRFE